MMKRKTIEEYIETIDMIQHQDGHAKTSKISIKMHIQPSSVTEMVQKLQKEGYVHYQPYKGATLTKKGKTIAHELMKKHRIIADFLEIIGIEKRVAEVDACQIEHHVNKKTMEQLGKFVEFINDAPHEPKWIDHFNYFVQTGKRKHCTWYDEKEDFQKS